ncbi:hypothetical protein [Pseudomonas moraviensis]|uniref:hypothetical protein n=1 Tax=Pseudomonas moraviensis TaxID=321662 RepID=UPI0015807BCE|nr:hypothetical protein [Pseudomonas moraviensis]
MNAARKKRLKAGQLDPTFGPGGMIIPELGVTTSRVTETADGKLLYLTSGNGASVFRVTAQGQDNDLAQPRNWTFREDPNEDPFYAFTALLARDNGNFLIAGSTGDAFTRNIAISQFDASGNEDPYFKKNIFPLPGGVRRFQRLETHEPVACLAPDNHVLIAGSYRVSEDDGAPVKSAILIHRLDDKGVPDTSFNHTGTLEVQFNGGRTRGSAIAVLPDKRIVVFGTAETQTCSRAAMACFDPSGKPDPMFAHEGQWEGDDYTVFGKMIVHGNKIVIATVGGDNESEHKIVVRRMLADGSPDPSFADGKPLQVPLDTSYLFPPSVAVQSDGKIVVSGTLGFGLKQMYWLRVRENGEGPDADFGEDGVVKAYPGRVQDVISQDGSKRIIVACGLEDSSGSSPRVFGIVR